MLKIRVVQYFALKVSMPKQLLALNCKTFIRLSVKVYPPYSKEIGLGRKKTRWCGKLPHLP